MTGSGLSTKVPTQLVCDAKERTSFKGVIVEEANAVKKRSMHVIQERYIKVSAVVPKVRQSTPIRCSSIQTAARP